MPVDIPQDHGNNRTLPASCHSKARLIGITAKLDYIQSVGCNAIWINPIYESPFGDAGYDVADLYKVASRYGTNEDLKNLCAIRRSPNSMCRVISGHSGVNHVKSV